MEGERSGLFFEIMRLAKEIKPTFIFLENVPAITGRGGLRVVREITSLGYDCRWCVISAASVGALHRRERWFLLAHSNSSRLQKERAELQATGFTGKSFESSTPSSFPNSMCQGLEGQRRRTFTNEKKQPRTTGNGEDDSDALCKSSEQADCESKPINTSRETWRNHKSEYWPFESRDDWQKTVHEMVKCVDGVSAKLDFNKDQLKALGNAVVPQQVRKAFKILIGIND